MFGLCSETTFWFIVAIQVAGILSVLFARAAGSPAFLQGVFFGCLTLVAAATMLSLSHGNGYWASCGTTLTLMVVGVTIDLKATRRVTVF